MFRKKRRVRLAFLLAIIGIAGASLGVFSNILLAGVKGPASSTLIFGALASMMAFLSLPLLHLTFEYLRTARVSVSSNGLVPRRWTVLDVLRRRRIIPWSEVFDLRVERHPRGSWWVGITLDDIGWRDVRSGAGIPDNFVGECRYFASLHGVPVIDENQ
ncbi:MAG: hypothetical protein E6K16_07450 [Methanobacteriota archaeon]|nr:MAG: hypothetical protein E6K16_07450 [Euryarchaeota archaeon]